MKIIYIGELREIRIKAGNAIFNKWKKGEVKDIGENEANLLLKNKNFKRVEKKVKKEQIVEKKINKYKSNKLIKEED